MYLVAYVCATVCKNCKQKRVCFCVSTPGTSVFLSLFTNFSKPARVKVFVLVAATSEECVCVSVRERLYLSETK